MRLQGKTPTPQHNNARTLLPSTTSMTVASFPLSGP